MKTHPLYRTFPAIAIALALLACGEEKTFFQTELPAEGIRIKLMHTVYEDLEFQPSTGPKAIRSIDFLIDNRKVSGNPVAYGGTFPTIDYATLSTATSLSVRAPFTEASATSPQLEEKLVIDASSLSLAPAEYYTVALIGPVSARQVVVFEDNINDLPLNGQAYVRFINLAPNSGNKFNLVATPPPPSGGGTSTPVVWATNVAYKEMNAGGFISIPPGAYSNIQVKDAVTNATVLTLAGASSTFIGNRVYSIVVRGQVGLTTSDPKRALIERVVNR